MAKSGASVTPMLGFKRYQFSAVTQRRNQPFVNGFATDVFQSRFLEPPPLCYSTTDTRDALADLMPLLDKSNHIVVLVKHEVKEVKPYEP